MKTIGMPNEAPAPGRKRRQIETEKIRSLHGMTLPVRGTQTTAHSYWFQVLGVRNCLSTPNAERRTPNGGIGTMSNPIPVSSPPAVPGHRLVVVILKDAGAVDQLLGRFAESGVHGATVLDARGMAEHLAAHLSLFAGFKAAFTAVGHSQVVLTVVAASRSAEVLALASAVGGLQQPGTGIAFAIDVAGVVGLATSETP